MNRRTFAAIFSLVLPLASAAPSSLRADTKYPEEIEIAASYSGHLQGFCLDKAGHVYWSFNTGILKTDLTGKPLKQVTADNHQGDLCFADGKLYVAVNLGKFNRPAGEADSWVYEYDPVSLELLKRHSVPEVVHGAGGIVRVGEHFYVVGGLPEGIPENYVYEYSADFRFVREHVLTSGWTKLGIQTVEHDGASWWFGCYGSPHVMLRADGDLKFSGRHLFDVSYGIASLKPDLFYIARGTRSPEGKFGAKLQLAVPDANNGLKLLSDSR